MFCEENPVVETAKALAWVACINYQKEYVVNVSRTGGRTSCYVKRKDFKHFTHWKIRVSDHPLHFHNLDSNLEQLYSFDYCDDDGFSVALAYLGRGR